MILNILFSVSHLAGVFARSLKAKLEKDAETIPIKKIQERKQYSFEDEEVLCVQIAGLCHDLGILLLICHANINFI